MTIKLVYIMGAAYSGSTILRALLGSQPDVECVGELARWTLYPDEPRRRCASGALVRDCEYWSQVSRVWEASSSAARRSTYAHLQRRYERLRSAPWIMLGVRVRSPGLASHRRISQSLLEAIATTSGKMGIVDMSKDPARGLAVSMVEGVDVRFVHLVRDGVAFMALRMKRSARHADGPFGLPSAMLRLLQFSMEWVLANQASEEVIRLTRHSWARLHYESLANDVAGSLGTLSSAHGIDLDGPSRRARRGDKVAFAHMMAGNEVRLKGPVPILSDMPSARQVPQAASRVFGPAAGRTARHHGYGQGSIARLDRSRSDSSVAS